MSSNENRLLFVGNLPPGTNSRDLRNLFYGRNIMKVVWDPRQPSFGFVEFENIEDAQEAITNRNNYEYCGHVLLVQYARREFQTGKRSPRTPFRLLVSGLPPSASWQDLKDHMRKAGDVCFTKVFKTGGSGYTEFSTYTDMKNASIKLHNSRFTSHQGETSYIKVREGYSGGGRKYSTAGEGSLYRSVTSRRRNYSPRSRQASSSEAPRRYWSPSRPKQRMRSRSRSYSGNRS